MVSTVWSGSISFGLVNIPIKLYTATDTSKDFSFNQLDAEGHRIRYKKWCPIEEREVPYSEIKKGYEIAKDQVCCNRKARSKQDSCGKHKHHRYQGIY